MYKIACIGDRDSVMGFMAIGFSVFDVENTEQAAETLKKLASQDYAVIFIIESMAREMTDIIAKYRSQPLPAIIAIPGKDGSSGWGMDAIKKSVERAVGADII